MIFLLPSFQSEATLSQWPVNASHAVRSGDNLTLSLSLDKLHLFDAESGVSLNAMAYATPTAPTSVSA